MKTEVRPNVLEKTTSLCPFCLERLSAEVVEQDGKALLTRVCPRHGVQVDLLEEDAEYFRCRDEFTKAPPQIVSQTQSSGRCPFDCGLCTCHQQHTCIALIEITQRCQLRCPFCYATSPQPGDLSLDEFERMLAFVLEAEGGSLDILQLSGGEPTLHRELSAMISLARKMGVKFVLLNTNGLAFLEKPDLLSELAEQKDGFEVYLQFDGVQRQSNEAFRGSSMGEAKIQILERLSRNQIPTTLVMSVANGVNEQEIGPVVVRGLQSPYVRGVSFQPVAYFGRFPDREVDRLGRATISGIISHLEQQMKGMIQAKQMVPLPCDPYRVAIGYFRKTPDGSLRPLADRSDALSNLKYIGDTLRFSPERMLAYGSHKPDEGCCGRLGAALRSCFTGSFFHQPADIKSQWVSANTFRITVTSFLDAYNFDLRACQRECVHVITPDLKRISFSAYNLYHRQRALNCARA